jgi:hypothetical protein
MQEENKRIMSREERERKERYRYTPYKPPENPIKQKEETEAND